MLIKYSLEGSDQHDRFPKMIPLALHLDCQGLAKQSHQPAVKSSHANDQLPCGRPVSGSLQGQLETSSAVWRICEGKKLPLRTWEDKHLSGGMFIYFPGCLNQSVIMANEGNEGYFYLFPTMVSHNQITPLPHKIALSMFNLSLPKKLSPS